MSTDKKPTFKDLIAESTLTEKDLSSLSGLNESTIRILKNRYNTPVTDKSKWKLVHALNKALNRNYSLSDIDS